MIRRILSTRRTMSVRSLSTFQPTIAASHSTTQPFRSTNNKELAIQPNATRPFSAAARHGSPLIRAHGPTGQLTQLIAQGSAALALKRHAITLPSITLNHRQLCDIELILNGGFSPLSGFMDQGDYDSVVDSMRLMDGTLFPMPLTLDVTDRVATSLEGVNEIALKDGEGNILAVMHISSIYCPDRQREAVQVFGGDPEHPAVIYLNRHSGSHYIGGTLQGLQLPPHYDHTDLRQTPAQCRQLFADNNWSRVTAFQTRNPLHRAHLELTLRACQDNQSALLLHPVVGSTKPGDIDHHTRVKCYRALMPAYIEHRTPAVLSVLSLAMRMAGPREAIWHAIIRQNHGATHFIIGRDHAGPGKNTAGRDFYSPYEARDLALSYQNDLSIQLTPFDMMMYVPSTDVYMTAKEVPPNVKTESLSGTEVRRRLETGEDIPSWFSYPAVVKILRSVHPPKLKQGYCVFFTGLSGSGKSTISNALQERLMSLDSRPLTLLDGDHVRQMLSSELGFSHEHRNLNIQRIGYVSSLIVKSQGAVIAAPIAPYASSRQYARDACKQHGGFIEVFVDASVDVCEKRDRKGLYAKARSGMLKHFTGIDDPYEQPTNPEVTIRSEQSVEEAVDVIVMKLTEMGFIAPAVYQATMIQQTINQTINQSLKQVNREQQSALN